jgi:hypothetical protein
VTFWARASKEGKGRKGRRKGRKERVCLRRGRKGAGLWSGWMDRSIDGQGREENKRLSGGRERRAAVKIRRGNGTKESHGQQWLEFVF